MSVESIAQVLHHSRATGSAKLVLVGIANHDGDGGAWPTHRTLARYANVHQDNIRKLINKLVELGEVRVHVQAGGTKDWPDHDRPNRYDVLVICPPWCDRTKHHRDTRETSGPQLGLGITGGAHTPPRGTRAPRGGAHTPPGGGAHTPPKPSIQPVTNDVGASTTDRARVCAVCSRLEWQCQLAAFQVPPPDRHEFVELVRGG